MAKLLTLLFTLLLVNPFSQAMTGIFWQPQNRDMQINDAHWQSLMNALHQQGVDTLVVQWTRYGDAFTQPQERTNLIHRAEAAKRAGLKVIVGLNADPDFFIIKNSHLPHWKIILTTCGQQIFSRRSVG